MPLDPIEGPVDPDGADCVACGRCCHHGPLTAQVREDDEARLSEDDLRHLTVLLQRPPYFRFMANDGERCAALDASTPGHYPCRVYARRPEGCRIVEPGSPACLEARALGELGTSLGFRRSDHD